MANRFSDRSLKYFDLVFMRDVISEHDVAFKHEHNGFAVRKFGLWRRIAMFFGLPVSLHQPNLLSNFVGWHHESAPAWQKALNYSMIKPVLIAVLNLMMMPMHFVKNVLLLAGVYLPKIINDLSYELFLKIANEEFESYKQKGVTWLTIPAVAAAGLLMLGVYLPSLFVSLFSEAMLSPLKLMHQFFIKARQNDNGFYKFLGFAFLLASVVMLTTAMVFGGQLLSPFIFAAASAMLPASIITSIGSVYGSVCIALMKVLPTVAMVFNFISLGVFKALMVPTGISALDAGMAVSLSMVSLSLLAVFDSIKDSLKNWYGSFEKKEQAARSYQQSLYGEEEPLLSHSTEKLLASFAAGAELAHQAGVVETLTSEKSDDVTPNFGQSEEYVLESDDESMGFKPAKL